MEISVLHRTETKEVVEVKILGEGDSLESGAVKTTRLSEVEKLFELGKNNGAIGVTFVETRAMNDDTLVRTSLKVIAGKLGLVFQVKEREKGPLLTPDQLLSEDDMINVMIAKIKKHFTNDVTVYKSKTTREIVVASTMCGRTLGMFSGDMGKVEKIAQRIKQEKVRVQIQVMDAGVRF